MSFGKVENLKKKKKSISGFLSFSLFKICFQPLFHQHCYIEEKSLLEMPFSLIKLDNIMKQKSKIF